MKTIANTPRTKVTFCKKLDCLIFTNKHDGRKGILAGHDAHKVINDFTANQITDGIIDLIATAVLNNPPHIERI